MIHAHKSLKGHPILVEIRFRDLAKLLDHHFSNLAKSLDILGIWPNPWVKQGFGQIAESFRDLAKSLVWQSYCNIYTLFQGEYTEIIGEIEHANYSKDSEIKNIHTNHRKTKSLPCR